MSLGWEVTTDDILIVCRKHNTVLTQAQLEEVFDVLDHDLITMTALSQYDSDDQNSAALGEIEYQMVACGLYITEPYLFWGH